MITAIVLLLLVAFVLFEVLWIKLNGDRVPRPEVARGLQMLGNGTGLTYVVLGDSTAVSQGGDYEQGYAVQTAQYLAREYAVSWANVAVPGARAADVAGKQATQAAAFKPDVALVAVGANDITHLTSIGDVRRSVEQIITKLREANPSVRVILTGSPDMGSPPRIPPLLRQLAGGRTKTLNAELYKLADGHHVFFAPIAERTGPAFRKDRGLFAADNFHPTADGYKLWTPVITPYLDKALAGR